MQKIRPLKDLFQTTKPVYIYLDSIKTYKEFLKNATDEGITYYDGSSLASKDGKQYYRLYKNGTISNVYGMAAHMILHSSTNIHRINYANYVIGEESDDAGKPLALKSHTSENLIIVDCSKNSLQQKKDFYNWLLDKSFDSWSLNFNNYNFIAMDLNEKLFYLKQNDCDNTNCFCKTTISIHDFIQLYRIFYK